jgi:hypothetical protein
MPNTEAAFSHEVSGYFYQTTRRHIWEDRNLNDIKSFKLLIYSVLTSVDNFMVFQDVMLWTPVNFCNFYSSSFILSASTSSWSTSLFIFHFLFHFVFWKVVGFFDGHVLFACVVHVCLFLSKFIDYILWNVYRAFFF